MDISKAGQAGLPNQAAETAKGGPGGAGGAERSFADVMNQDQGPGGSPNLQGPSGTKSPFAAPILDADLSSAKVGGNRRVPQAGEASFQHRAQMEMVGERPGRAPGAANPVDPSQSSGSTAGTWQKMVNDTSKAENRMDKMIADARNGKAFSASELLALQVEVFRYSQTVEVISRSTDKLVGAIKQTLGTQV